jgi:adenylate kinase family enzyme
VERVWVVGNSGSGKTTVARELARRLDLPHLELDSVYHQAGWQPLGAEEFRDRVTSHVEGPSWVVDGNYAQVGDLLGERADTLVWIDLPRSSVMRQLAARTLSRGLRRKELWNGNRETLRSMLSRDPEKSIMLWAWRHHHVYAERYAALAARSAKSAIDVVRLRSRREVEDFLTEVGVDSR